MTFQPDECQPKCDECPLGKFTNSVASAACLDVAAGFILSSARTGEVACEPGTYATEGLLSHEKTCESCSPGRFSESSGSIFCEYCPMGMHAALPGQTACRNCTAPGILDKVNGDDDIDTCITCSFFEQSAEEGPMTTVCTSCFSSVKVMLSPTNCGILTSLITVGLCASVSGVLFLVREITLRTKETPQSKNADAQEQLLDGAGNANP